MIVLDPSIFVVASIDQAGTQRFEAFLDRNYPNWRDSIEQCSTSPLEKAWYLSTNEDVGVRHAIYRAEFVELYDEFESVDEKYGFDHTNFRICAIDGDLTPIAVWGQRH